jgi:hypothetical protein
MAAALEAIQSHFGARHCSIFFKALDRQTVR